VDEVTDIGGTPGDGQIANKIRTDIAHPARIYDYWLGGKDNFEVDRALAERALELLPHLRTYARSNRQFLSRAVRFLCEAGIRQFLDIGTGLPTSPNVHEIAQRADPGSRVVYVDNDPMVFLHAEALMTKGSERTLVVRADMRDADDVLAQAGALLDFRAPVGLMFVACLHHLEDHDDPAALVARYLKAMAPGSYLVLSHGTDDFAPEAMRQGEAEARKQGMVINTRGKDAILRMFNGRELLEPGLVLVSKWRPDSDQPDPNADHAMAYGGIAAL
jgi:SAM-dependent methyltransferase